MSDGPSDCARAAYKVALEFIRKTFPGLMVVEAPNLVPAKGKIVLVYEEYIDHIVEVVEDQRVTQRFRIDPFTRPVRLGVTGFNCQIGALR